MSKLTHRIDLTYSLETDTGTIASISVAVDGFDSADSAMNILRELFRHAGKHSKAERVEHLYGLLRKKAAEYERWEDDDGQD